MPAQETPTRPPTRLACERCRNQKLRCEWPKDGTTKTCHRCSRKGVYCMRTLSCRPGRPSRLREANATPISSPSLVEQQPLPLLMSPLPVEQQPLPLPPLSNTGWSPSYSQVTLMDHTPDVNTPQYSPGFNSMMTTQDGDVMSSLSSEWRSFDLAGVLPPDENADDQQVGWSLPSPSPSSLQDAQSYQNPLKTVWPQQEVYHPTSEPQQQGLHSLPEQFLASAPSPYSPSPSFPDHQNVQTRFGDGDVCNAASLTSHLMGLMYLCQSQFSLETSSASSSTSTPGGPRRQQHASKVCLSGILTCIQRLLSLLAPYLSPWDGRHGSLSGVMAAVMDGPTNLLILSCYAKIFEAFRQLMSGVYSRLLSGQATTNLYRLKIDDIAIDGDGHLEILILMQIITHKLDTLGAILGVPAKHRVGAGRDLKHAGGAATALEADVAVAEHHRVAETYWEAASLDDLLSGSAGSKHVFGEEGSPMESAAAAFREELRLIRGLLDHKWGEHMAG
ncbi:hypothetical protein PpBr36_01399 [Pyricularia pennisetigena]|uniref:hypothetical protein n=1 Tax=Pyricularia pennisetigena TaxID=1578925 RepID=UPI00115228EE|nr:hypothetical protein PpBr36_01399 [Pyricularia pennisetigena]TLS28042.1 hypothetical protein PpBr36_01399 [Pyricularia pennisetigena]